MNKLDQKVVNFIQKHEITKNRIFFCYLMSLSMIFVLSFISIEFFSLAKDAVGFSAAFAAALASASVFSVAGAGARAFVGASAFVGAVAGAVAVAVAVAGAGAGAVPVAILIVVTYSSIFMFAVTIFYKKHIE